MSQFRQEEVKGLIRNDVDKRDKGEKRQGEYTAVLNDGRKVLLDKGEASSLMSRLDKDRSRMEKDGSRSPEREPERRAPSQVASDRDKQAFLNRFKQSR